ncbi:conserved hypothetical protein [Trichormus variabilis ATCC 29413]|uniref:KGK family protein n=2 Tax=Anabaena variabilis TaxID=264691 RepID=Q3MB37_TRIV2|nr:conserved hypothetical protein [Trichormus variabilis ATCC 29413]
MGTLCNDKCLQDIEMKRKRILLGDKDVISTQKDKSPISASTFKANEIHCYLRDKITRDIGSEAAISWVFEGLPCEVIRENTPEWQSGKVWISLEFVPDDLENDSAKDLAESPLDDLRTELLDKS